MVLPKARLTQYYQGWHPVIIFGKASNNFGRTSIAKSKEA
jgi:hypothetical protein